MNWYSLRITSDLPALVGARVTYPCGLWPVVSVKPEYKDDKSIMAHEVDGHVHQFWTGGMIIHAIRYTKSREYRKRCEVEAYKLQLKLRPDCLDWFAERLAIAYDLGITKDEALKLLSN